jgi:hypothetical protein
VVARPWLTFGIDTMLGKWEAADCQHRSLRAFRRFVLLHGCVRSWLWLALAVDQWRPGLTLSALVVSVAFGLAWHPRTEWLAPRLALPALLLQLTLSLPLTDNHFFLEVYALGLLSLLGRRDRSVALVLGSLRWLVVIVLFQTGLQKVLYGQYFSGEFLAFMVGQGERFAAPFGLILSGSQIEVLQSYDVLRTGQGPFRVDSLLFIGISNLVWISELALAGLVLLARTRGIAVFAAMALVASIQLAAREFGFAFLFVNLLLLFTARGNERALPVLILLYAYALGAELGLVPGGSLIELGSL